MIPKKLHILLAEDDPDDRLFFEEALKEIKIKHSLTILKDGSELLKYLKEADLLPHILFLDLNMPKKSGIECLQEIRKDEKFSNLCVAIYSTSSAEVDLEGTFVAGANVYIKKPTNIETLKKIISNVVTVNWQYITDGMDRENFMLNY
jgi:CheY-like chemotaxis protein